MKAIFGQRAFAIAVVAIAASTPAHADIISWLFGSGVHPFFSNSNTLGHKIEDHIASWAHGCFGDKAKYAPMFAQGLLPRQPADIEAEGLNSVPATFGGANVQNVMRFAFTSAAATDWKNEGANDTNRFIGPIASPQNDVLIREGTTEDDIVADCGVAAKIVTDASAGGSYGIAEVKVALSAAYSDSGNHHLILTYGNYVTSLSLGLFDQDPRYVVGSSYDVWMFYWKQQHAPAVVAGSTFDPDKEQQFFYVSSFTGWTTTALEGIERKLNFKQSADAGAAAIIGKLSVSESLQNDTTLSRHLKSYNVYVVGKPVWQPLPKISSIVVPPGQASYVSDMPVSDSYSVRVVHVVGIPVAACTPGRWTVAPEAAYDQNWDFGSVVPTSVPGGCDFSIEVKAKPATVHANLFGDNVEVKFNLTDASSAVNVGGSIKLFNIPGSMRFPTTDQPILVPEGGAKPTVVTADSGVGGTSSLDIASSVIDSRNPITWTAFVSTDLSLFGSNVDVTCGSSKLSGKLSVTSVQANRVNFRLAFDIPSKPDSLQCTVQLSITLPSGHRQLKRESSYSFTLPRSQVEAVFPAQVAAAPPTH